MCGEISCTHCSDRAMPCSDTSVLQLLGILLVNGWLANKGGRSSASRVYVHRMRLRFSCTPALVSERGIARSEQGVLDMTQRLKHVVASRTACKQVMAPARANVETDSNHCDELLLRASAGVRTRHCSVRARRARYDSEAQARRRFPQRLRASVGAGSSQRRTGQQPLG